MDDSNRKKSVDELSRTPEQTLEAKDGLDTIDQDITAPVDGIAPGAILSERYEVLEFLGQGGMGTVYKARHTLIGNVVAIKVMHPHLLKDGASQERFKAEAKAAIGLRHERLMAVTDYGVTSSGQPFIVMEFVQGVGLDDLLEEKKVLSLDEFFEIFPQVCDGLAHVHEKGVVHRDIKPSNIMLSKTHHDKWMVHIVDFGIAKVLPSGQGAVQHLTQTGEIFGSPLYMSPEQCKGRSVDARSDIYSLGCVMFEALTGSPPHQGESAIETLMMHVNEKAQKLSERRAEIGECAELDKIVAAALDAAPDLRYQTMSHLKSDLEQRKFSGNMTAVPASCAASGVASSATSSPSSYATPTSSGAMDFKNTFLSPLIIVAAAALTVWLINAFGITQPRVAAIVNGGDDQNMREADLEFQLAKEKASQGFNLEAAELSQKSLDLRSKYAPNTLALAESMNQRADIALHDAEHERLMLQGKDHDSADDSMSSVRKKRIADDYALAEKLLKRAIVIADAKTEGEEKSISPVRFRNTLVTAYLDRGKYREAETTLNELSPLFLEHRAETKIDPEAVQKAFHDLFDEQYERLYWGTNREVEAAKLRIAHHRGQIKYDEAALIANPSQPFTGSWESNTFLLQLIQNGNALSGVNEIRNFGFDPSTKHENSVKGTVEGNVAHLTCTSAIDKGEQIKAAAVRIANVLVFHVTNSAGVREEGYVPDNAILEAVSVESGGNPSPAPAPAPPTPAQAAPAAPPALPSVLPTAPSDAPADESAASESATSEPPTPKVPQPAKGNSETSTGLEK